MPKNGNKNKAVLRPQITNTAMKLKMKLGSKSSSDGVVKAKKNGGLHGAPAWMTNDPGKQRRMAEQQRQQQNRKFIPEMWFKDGDEKIVRFRDPGAVTCLWQYKFMTKGGRYEKVTAPAEGEENLFLEEAGMKPSFCAVYEVIDIAGYVDKDGKRKKNVARFLLASHKVYMQLEKIRIKRDGLDKQNIEISRTGEKAQTSYTFLPEDKEPMTPEMRKAERLSLKIQELFAPPSPAEQRELLNQMVHDRS